MVRNIIAEDAKRYRVDWEDGSDGEKFEPTWEPKENVNALAVMDWERVKAEKVKAKKRRSVPEAGPAREKRRLVQGTSAAAVGKSGEPTSSAKRGQGRPRKSLPSETPPRKRKSRGLNRIVASETPEPEQEPEQEPETESLVVGSPAVIPQQLKSSTAVAKDIQDSNLDQDQTLNQDLDLDQDQDVNQEHTLNQDLSTGQEQDTREDQVHNHKKLPDTAHEPVQASLEEELHEIQDSYPTPEDGCSAIEDSQIDGLTTVESHEAISLEVRITPLLRTGDEIDDSNFQSSQLISGTQPQPADLSSEQPVDAAAAPDLTQKHSPYKLEGSSTSVLVTSSSSVHTFSTPHRFPSGAIIPDSQSLNESTSYIHTQNRSENSSRLSDQLRPQAQLAKELAASVRARDQVVPESSAVIQVSRHVLSRALNAA